MDIKRILNVADILEKKSVMLLGPRQTGKSWLIRNTLPGVKVFNLLESETFLQLSREPQRLRFALSDSDKIVVIDEIQLIPILLNEVQILIEEKGVKFLLTGSSARKLRRGGVNLLGGRARSRQLHPFVYAELREHFDIIKAVNYGTIPSIYFSDSPQEDLGAYTGDYLREEITAEGLTRNVPAFSRFLQIVSQAVGQIINYSKIANDSQVSYSTVRTYFDILIDTLIGYKLMPYGRGRKRKEIQTAKFYLFDCGVSRYLQNRNIANIKTPEFGHLFESYIFHELKSYVDYQLLSAEALSFWRSKSGYEVDFVFNDQVAIEVKASDNISAHDLKGLRAIREEATLKRFIVVCFENKPRKLEFAEILPWRDFLEQLWDGGFK